MTTKRERLWINGSNARTTFVAFACVLRGEPGQSRMAAPAWGWEEALPFFVNDPKHWRQRAEESRALAETLSDSVARNQMIEVAAAYDRMAERAANFPIESPLKPEGAA